MRGFVLDRGFFRPLRSLRWPWAPLSQGRERGKLTLLARVPQIGPKIRKVLSMNPKNVFALSAKTGRFRRPTTATRWSAAGSLAAVALLALVACERSADAGTAPKAEPAAQAQAAAASAPAAEPTAQGNYREEGFVLSLEVAGPLEVGKPAEARVTLKANDPYKVNQEYPIKLNLVESPGLGIAATTVGKDAVELGAKQAVMKVPLTPKAAGEHKLAGRFAFSVCTDERCLIEKRDLAVQVSVR